jgi:hypothetical protein
MVNLPMESSYKPVTRFGGMVLMKRFLDQTGIREQLGKPMPSQSTYSRFFGRFFPSAQHRGFPFVAKVVLFPN